MTAPQGLRTRILTVDLKMAELLLSFEKPHTKGAKGTNRKHSDALVNKYCFEMLAGRWGFSHQGFAVLGYLEDGTADFRDGGQRARAVRQACTVGATLGDKTYPPRPDFKIEVMFTEGLDETSWLVMDIGKSRRPGDFLSSEGEVNTNVLSSTISLCWMYENGGTGKPYAHKHWSTSFLTPLMRQEYLDANPGLREAIYEGARLGLVMTVAAACAANFLALKSGADKKLVQDFMDSMAEGTGANWVKGNPALTLREMMLNARRGKRRLTRQEQLALFIKAFNAYGKGHEIYGLSYRTKQSSSGAAPETFPTFATFDN